MFSSVSYNVFFWLQCIFEQSKCTVNQITSHPPVPLLLGDGESPRATTPPSPAASFPPSPSPEWASRSPAADEEGDGGAHQPV